MRVYKFGGASIKDAWGVKNLCEIVSREDEKLVVVVSALGKTTNELEKLVESLLGGGNDYKILSRRIIDFHMELASELFGKEEAVDLLGPLNKEMDDTLKSLKTGEYDFVYDQVVSYGELWSTKIVERWLGKSNIQSKWIDIREQLITDKRFRDADVNWEESARRIGGVFATDYVAVHVTQGFLGGTIDGDTTTLGREGSDFSAAIIANICDAKDVIIWKDVPGVLNADPKWMDGASRLDRISYKEAVEMSFSGAKVLHPKTIKPLHNKSIPLYVKSFLEPEGPGTIISVNESLEQDIPVYVRKESQVLISFIPKDFSFVIGDNLGILFQIFNRIGIKTNLVQASAVSLAVCVDNEPGKIEEVSQLLHPDYKILLNGDVEMLTVRYYNEDTINSLIENREVLIEQRTRKSIRFVLK